NRTVKRLYADDSADSRVKVGNRQAPLKPETPARKAGVFAFGAAQMRAEVTKPPHVSLERRTPESGLHHPEPIPAFIAASSGHADGSYRFRRNRIDAKFM
ncbi:hypothetical protein, partial [Burkholderia territorii]|uniref:hypothetical protein n=1 Tax=Burkholderia territorii TaxID=1503055 RepID=UPI001E3ED196